MTTATSPFGMGPILGHRAAWTGTYRRTARRIGYGTGYRAGLLAGGDDGLVDHGEHRVEPGDLEDLAHGRARGGELELATALLGPAQRRQQHVHAGGVAEHDAGHVDDHPRGPVVGQHVHQLAVQPRCGVQVDFARHDHDGVIIGRAARDVEFHERTIPSSAPPCYTPALIGAPGPDVTGSRLTGQVRLRGPPRALPSSLPGTRVTSRPACSSRALIAACRSNETAWPTLVIRVLPPSSHGPPGAAGPSPAGPS